MKKKLSLVSLILLLVMLMSTPALAATVCKIGSKGYSTLQKAVNAVKNGQTITVTKAIKATDRVEVSNQKKFIIDFRKKKYTSKGGFTAFGIGPNSNVTVKNAKIDVQGVAFDIGQSAVLTIKSGTIKAGNFLIYGRLNIKGGTFTCNQSVNDAFFYIQNTGTVKVSKGTITDKPSQQRGWGSIFRNGGGTLSISGGTFTFGSSQAGNMSVIVSAGTAVISGGTFKALGDNYCITPGGNATCTVTVKGGSFTSDRIVVQTVGASSLRLEGGTFKTLSKKINPGIVSRGESSINISGGSFNGGFNLMDTSHMYFSGGTTDGAVVVNEGASATIKKLTIKQKPSPGYGPESGAMLVNMGGELIVEGGKFVSKNGYGYSGDVTFAMDNYEKLFTVKAMTP